MPLHFPSVTTSIIVRRHEGLRLQPYRCTGGKLTIGYGRNLEDRGITKDEAVKMLDRDLRESAFELERIPEVARAWPSLGGAQRAVLISMIFNLGPAGLRKFRRMLAALERLDFTGVSQEMLDSLWAQQVRTRAIELAKMMRTNEWPEMPPSR